MYVRHSKSHRPSHTTSMRLNNQQLEVTDTFKYLAYIVANTMDDTLDISKQMRSIYARSNLLNVKFGSSTKFVKYVISVILYNPANTMMYEIPGNIFRLVDRHECTKN